MRKSELTLNHEWDGGIPPIGTVCEYHWAADEWRRCEIVAYYYANVVAVDVFDSTAFLLQPMMFRPIKTPEQPAADVSGLVEALELMVTTHDEGGWPTAAVEIARAALAAHRKEGDAWAGVAVDGLCGARSNANLPSSGGEI